MQNMYVDSLMQETEEVAVIMADAQATEDSETILVLPPDQTPHSTVLLQVSMSKLTTLV